MTILQSIRELIASGQFGTALSALESRTGIDQFASDMFRLELLERVGQHDEARRLAHQILKRRALPSEARSTCEFVLGRVEWDASNTDTAVFHFQRSVTFAAQAGDRASLCWRQLWLWQVICEKSGADAAVPYLGEVRANIIRVADTRLTAAGHIFVGKQEAKRGSLETAELHTNLGQRFLRDAPNCLLSALAENTHVALAIMRCDFDAGLAHAQRGLDFSEQSGVATVIRASLGNLGNLYFLNGDFDLATEYIERARRVLPGGENAYAGVDTVAKIRLLQGKIAECSDLLDTIDGSLRTPDDRHLYLYRHTLLTRAALLSKQRRFVEAGAQIQLALSLAEQAGDRLLIAVAAIAKAESLQRIGHPVECCSLLTELFERFHVLPLDAYARYECVVASGLKVEGRTGEATRHEKRAQVALECLRNVPGLMEIETLTESSGSENVSDSTEDSHSVRPVAGNVRSSVLQSISAVLSYAQNPELVARELARVIMDCECTSYVCALSRESNGTEEALFAHGNLGDAQRRVFKIGEYRGRTIELILIPNSDFGSTASINAIMSVITFARELQQARTERQERAPLWPAEDANISAHGAVISGRMRELMSFAQRVARTSINVLVTGESGTGKEILARAVHNFSERAHKPFVPVNCAAVPRELLESHLFGHRRGAFTGADRDHTGFIRTARDGTLFLDEVGELGLDLQPKLLRFLESGEISPLGEPAPLIVNVRIIAATNRNLEELVRDGRFREDLFYRLNVVPLNIPPLRERRDEIPGMVNHFVQRAAEEFRKGHLTVAEETMERLILYRWPGNVRQLHNELRRIVALAEPNSTLLPDMIGEDILGAMPLLRPGVGREIAVSLSDKLPLALRKIECEMIKVALHEHRGRVDAAAKALGISRKGLYLKRQRLGL